MTGNIIGEEFQKYVLDQIQSRQVMHGKGMDSVRSSSDINYLSNRNAWIKMASSVQVDEINRVEKIGLDSNFNGVGLAKKAILFNSLTELKGDSYNNRAGLPLPSDKGVWTDHSAYGLGGTQFGLQPSPGITSVSIDTVNRGSIRKATITLKAFNRFQFELIELLYLRLGFTMMLEWGWDKYINDHDSNHKIEPVGNTLIEDWWFSTESDNATQLEVLQEIEKNRAKYCGNYDGFFGKVSNYNWKFQSDGSYDISLNLITVGDVVESLQARVAATDFTVPSGSNDSINSSVGNTVIDKWLYEKTLSDSNFKPKTDYIIGDVIYSDNTVSMGGVGSGTYTNYSPDKKPDYGDINKYRYYVTFGELVNKLNQLCIPLIKNGTSKSPQLYFDQNVDNIFTKIFPNQLPINNKVCLFEPYLSSKDFELNTINYKMPYLKPYIVPKNSIMVGQLMNLYLNFDFIFTVLKGNVDKQTGRLSLYRFLEDICNGINEAMGGVNKIHPVLKEDNIITFIDQSLQSSPSLNKRDPKIAKIEVYGYNMADKTSNFVKNIEFQTKLSKETSAMISIGATAGGDTTSIKNGDATAFSKWNEGLTDRFCQNIEDPEEGIYTDSTKPLSRVNTQNSNIALIPLQTFISTYSPLTIRIPNPSLSNDQWKKVQQLTINYINKLPDESTITDSISQKAYDIAKLNIQSRQKEIDSQISDTKLIETDSSTSFIKYILDAFGGDSKIYNIKQQASSRNIKYHSDKQTFFKYDLQFIERGKSLYPVYIAYKARQKYQIVNEKTKQKEQSSQIGFLPLEFNLTVDGISGMKIYNKLNIAQNFLPRNYPETFDFVVTKLNHKIDNTGWETEIGTLSTSNIDDIIDEEGNGVVATQNPPSVEQKKVDINNNTITTASVLKAKQINKIQAAAIMGNISVETGDSFSPLQKQGGGGPAIGLIQWEPKWYSNDGTQNGVLDRVGRTIQSQIDYLFSGTPDKTGHKKDMKGWLQMTQQYTNLEGLNLSNAVQLFERKIEGAGKPNIGQRISKALYFYNQFKPGGKLDWNNL